MFEREANDWLWIYEKLNKMHYDGIVFFHSRAKSSLSPQRSATPISRPCRIEMSCPQAMWCWEKINVRQTFIIRFKGTICGAAVVNGSSGGWQADDEEPISGAEGKLTSWFGRSHLAHQTERFQIHWIYLTHLSVKEPTEGKREAWTWKMNHLPITFKLV